MLYGVYLYQSIVSIIVFSTSGMFISSSDWEDNCSKMKNVICSIVCIIFILSCVGLVTTPVAYFAEKYLVSKHISNVLTADSTLKLYEEKLKEYTDYIDICFDNLPDGYACKSNERLLVDSYNNYTVQSKQINYIDGMYVIMFDKPIYLANAHKDFCAINGVELKLSNMSNGVEVIFSPYFMEDSIVKEPVPQVYVKEVTYTFNND